MPELHGVPGFGKMAMSVVFRVEKLKNCTDGRRLFVLFRK
jgi:hypothetical protein